MSNSVMRVTKKFVYSEMRRLAKETGLKLELNECGYVRHPRFILFQTDENGTVIKTLIEDEYTTREMHLALKAAREIYKAASLQNIGETQA